MANFSHAFAPLTERCIYCSISREEVENDPSKALCDFQLLDLKVDEPKFGVESSPAISTVRHPLLLEATIRLQDRSTVELLPASRTDEI